MAKRKTEFVLYEQLVPEPFGPWEVSTTHRQDIKATVDWLIAKARQLVGDTSGDDWKLIVPRWSTFYVSQEIVDYCISEDVETRKLQYAGHAYDFPLSLYGLPVKVSPSGDCVELQSKADDLNIVINGACQKMGDEVDSLDRSTDEAQQG